jgi:pSer/pThr/pTyr-binding forkhead associated (FHA) protein
MMNKLVIADEDGKTTVVPLVRDEITIGRKEGNTIRLTDRNVSRRHARLLRSNGRFVVEDLDSYNGVRINGEPLAKPRSVSDGDRITIGDYQLSLRSDHVATAVEADHEAEEPPGHARLVMLSPPNPGQEFALDEPELVIGRTDENAIVINHRSISRSHAKVVSSDGQCRLLDLESANGVRVNGEDFVDVVLKTGDLVELGTVRLRFVAPREVYLFDADSTLPMDDGAADLLEDESRPSWLPLFVAAAVMLMVAVGVAWVFWATPAEQGGAANASPTEPAVVTKAPSSTLEALAGSSGAGGPTPDEVKARARELVEARRYAAAIGVLDSLGASADAEAQQLRVLAASEREAEQTWEAACNDTQPSDLQAQYMLCNRIRSSSRYFRHGCCSGIVERYGGRQLKKVRRLLTSRDYDQAQALAQSMFEDLTLPQDIRDEAKAMAGRAESRSGSRSTSRSRRQNQAASASRRGTNDSPPVSKASTRSNDEGSQSRPKRASSPAQALDEARAAVIRGDQGACIRALAKAPRTERVVRTLISCYQHSHNLSAACSLARRYERYAHARQFAQARCR